MAAIQAIHVLGHEERQAPSPHTVYRIEVRASVRSWQIWRRYSEFDELNKELTKSTSAPPAPLPSKHIWSIRSSFRSTPIIEERRVGLETYLRAILSAKDSRWRDTSEFKEFLGIPAGKQPLRRGNSGSGGVFTSSSWVDEQTDLQTIVRDVRADIQKRDALSDRGDIAGSHTANVEAQKKIAALLLRIGVLTKGLEGLISTLSGGEVQRRTDMVARLQDDCEKLGKMVIAARRMTKPTPSPVPATARSPDRTALIGSPPSPTRRATRVFGAPAIPKETAQTRPLDDPGLLQLQSAQMDQQDAQLSQLSTILRRQHQLGRVIGAEIEEQNEMLDGLTDDVDKVTAKLGDARKQMGRLS